MNASRVGLSPSSERITVKPLYCLDSELSKLQSITEGAKWVLCFLDFVCFALIAWSQWLDCTCMYFMYA